MGVLSAELSEAYACALVSLELPARSWDRVVKWSRQRDTTPFLALLTLSKRVLAAATGQTDVCVGPPVAGRRSRELEGAVGMFINVLPLRDRVDPDEPAEALLARVRRTFLDAFAHQDVPYELLLEDGLPPPVASLFALEDVSPTLLQISGVEVEQRDVFASIAEYDLSCFVREDRAGHVVHLNYTPDRFEAPTVRALGERFLEAIARLPEVRKPVREYARSRRSA